MASTRNNNSDKYLPSEKAIITTILYSDIFHFPLTREELWKFLMSRKTITKKEFLEGLQRLSPTILLHKDGYYCLRGRSEMIEKRKQNTMYVTKKNAFAIKIAQRLSYIPTILFIGISGSLAAKNVTREDDIDLFIITKKDSLFITRFLITVVLDAFRVRRRRLMRQAPDKICVNLLIDESAMCWDTKNRTIYTAREIAQVVPLFERDNCFERFITHNTWVSDYMPNIFEKGNAKKVISPKRSFFVTMLHMIPFRRLESVSRHAQLYYMKRHKTKEVIRNNHLGFHPVDYGAKTIEQLNLKMRQFGLLTID